VSVPKNKDRELKNNISRPLTLESAKNAENGKEREDCRLILEPSKIRRRFSSAGAEEKKIFTIPSKDGIDTAD
jgi:hypothetical protein